MSRENTVRQLLMKRTGARWAFISFPAGGERIAALLGGHVEMMILDPSEAGEQIRAGKLRAIAQVSEQRLPGFPDIPTIKEAGFDIPDVPQMRGIVGAPGMPADAVAYYEDLFFKVEPDAGLAEVPRREPARRRVRPRRRAEAVPRQLRRHAARYPEDGRRQGGAVDGHARCRTKPAKRMSAPAVPKDGCRVPPRA